MFQLSIPVRTRGAMAMTTPDIRLHALNWPCSVYVIINLPQHGLAVCNMIWTLTYMYVYSDSYRLYRLLLWGLMSPRPNWAKKTSSALVTVKALICLDSCVLADILLRLKRSADSSRVSFLINVICPEN